MIASCPTCQTRYRVAPEKIGPQGARIRCQKCQTIFKVSAAEAEAAPEAPRSEKARPKEFVARALLAEADATQAKRVSEYLEDRGIKVAVCEDGAEALLRLHRVRPDLAVLGSGLPNLHAPAICEILRRNADLQEVPLIRVAAADEPAGSPDFDADHTIEAADLPDGLGTLLEELGVGRRPAAAPREEAPRTTRAVSEPAPSRAPPPSPAPPKEGDAELRAAERLARIVISDIILYNEDKFAKAALAGSAAETLAPELEEAAAMFRERVGEPLREQRDFLREELERRAEKLRSKS